MSGVQPFAPQAISLRLYPHNELAVHDILREVCAQGVAGLSAGFDGVMTSEHHGGFAGYLPNPLQVASFILEESAHGWAAPCPLLLPLRPTAQLAEEIAWLNVRHPGRVGLGVAIGALPLDFDVMDKNLADALPSFRSELPKIVALLAGRDLGLLSGDKALQQCAVTPLPVLSAARSPGAARRAAEAGAGILLDGMVSIDQARHARDAYFTAGGTASVTLIRRVWLGNLDEHLVGDQRAVYESYAAGSFGADQTICSDDPDDLARQLADAVEQAGATGLNLRLHLPGMAPADIRNQIKALGDDVLPVLRRFL